LAHGPEEKWTWRGQVTGREAIVIDFYPGAYLIFSQCGDMALSSKRTPDLHVDKLTFVSIL
jgi:hypothetical protein